MACVFGHNFSFPSGAPWYTDVTNAPLDANSNNIITWLQNNGAWGTPSKFQIDFSLNILYADSNTPQAPVVQKSGYYSPDCDNVTSMPLPTGGAMEGTVPYGTTCSGDCHFVVVDQSAQLLYESFSTQIDLNPTVINSKCVVVWNLNELYPAEGRGDQCTSADAAGFPIAPLLWSADELAAGVIDHAIRFTLPNNEIQSGSYVRPASHVGGPTATDTDSPFYGVRLRLHQSFNITSLPNAVGTAAAPYATIFLTALKTYGMLLADGGGPPDITAQDDTFTNTKWASLSFDSHTLFGINVTDFDVVATSAPIPVAGSCSRTELTYPVGGTPITSAAASTTSQADATTSQADATTSQADATTSQADTTGESTTSQAGTSSTTSQPPVGDCTTTGSCPTNAHCSYGSCLCDVGFYVKGAVCISTSQSQSVATVLSTPHSLMLLACGFVAGLL